MNEHPDPAVQAAIVNLSDALCSRERGTSIESVIIIREAGFEYRAVNGKPGVPDDILDSDLFKMIGR